MLVLCQYDCLQVIVWSIFIGTSTSLYLITWLGLVIPKMHNCQAQLLKSSYTKQCSLVFFGEDLLMTKYKSNLCLLFHKS